MRNGRNVSTPLLDSSPFRPNRQAFVAVWAWFPNF
jgi:hypothetical protein